MNDAVNDGPPAVPADAPAVPAVPADAPAVPVASADAPAVPVASADAPAVPVASADAPAVPPAPADVPVPAAPVRTGRARRIFLAALPVVLVLGALGGAGVYTKITVDNADRTVGTTIWEDPEEAPGKAPAGSLARGRATTALSKLLLPVPAGYRLGPDVRELGNDSEVSGPKATAAMKKSNRGFAGKQRREFDKRIDKLQVQGLAVRSFVSEESDLVVTAEIMRMKDKKAVRNLYTLQKELFGALDIFRDGPKIDGHRRNAVCVLPPKDKKSTIENMVCTAFDGELSITLSASGIKPFDEAAVADLLKEQLDHIASPGEYV